MTFHRLNVCHATSPVLILTFKPIWNFIFTHEILYNTSIYTKEKTRNAELYTFEFY